MDDYLGGVLAALYFLIDWFIGPIYLAMEGEAALGVFAFFLPLGGFIMPILHNVM